MHFVVTGASGFVGRELTREILSRGHSATVVVRRESQSFEDDRVSEIVRSMDRHTDWKEVLVGCDVIVHLAAKVHVMKKLQGSDLQQFSEVNFHATMNLARQAVRCGVKRFIFLSSVKVNGEATALGKPFLESDPVAPSDPYAVSKRDAERELLALSETEGMDVVIIRSPLVYGPGVKANFRGLIKIVEIGIPLPIALVDNARSMVFLGNLIDFILLCSEHPKAKNQTFFVSDGKDVSTPQLIKRIAHHFGRTARLVSVRQEILRFVSRTLGLLPVYNRLVGNLQVSIDKAHTLLEWIPPFTFDQGIETVIESHLSNRELGSSQKEVV